MNALFLNAFKHLLFLCDQDVTGKYSEYIKVLFVRAWLICVFMAAVRFQFFSTTVMSHHPLPLLHLSHHFELEWERWLLCCLSTNPTNNSFFPPKMLHVYSTNCSGQLKASHKLFSDQKIGQLKNSGIYAAQASQKLYPGRVLHMWRVHFFRYALFLFDGFSHYIIHMVIFFILDNTKRKRISFPGIIPYAQTPKGSFCFTYSIL